MTKRKLLEENSVLKEQIKELKNELLGTQRQLLYKETELSLLELRCSVEELKCSIMGSESLRELYNAERGEINGKDEGKNTIAKVD